MTEMRMAPELVVDSWLNTDEPVQLSDLRGRVVVLYAFQILCHACVEQSMPQAKALHDTFAPYGVVVLGLHTVFESHDAMGADRLSEFVRNQELPFPIGIDRTAPGSSIPCTMRRYDMQGTPTLVGIDARGQRRFQVLGHVRDLQLAAWLAGLLVERARPDVA